MKQELLPQEEYYRPRRAAELRRHAANLASWAGRCEKAFLATTRIALFGTGGAGVPALVIGLLFNRTVDALLILSAAAFGSLFLWTFLFGLPSICFHHLARRQEVKALFLEAEHRARYGALPKPGPDVE